MTSIGRNRVANEMARNTCTARTVCDLLAEGKLATVQIAG